MNVYHFVGPISVGNKCLNIVVICRPPPVPTIAFFDELSDLISEVSLLSADKFWRSQLSW